MKSSHSLGKSRSMLAFGDKMNDAEGLRAEIQGDLDKIAVAESTEVGRLERERDYLLRRIGAYEDAICSPPGLHEHHCSKCKEPLRKWAHQIEWVGRLYCHRCFCAGHKPPKTREDFNRELRIIETNRLLYELVKHAYEAGAAAGNWVPFEGSEVEASRNEIQWGHIREVLCKAQRTLNPSTW